MITSELHGFSTIHQRQLSTRQRPVSKGAVSNRRERRYSMVQRSPTLFKRQVDPGAPVRGFFVASSDVLATKAPSDDENRHRDSEDDEGAAGRQRRPCIAAVLLAAVRPRAPGL